MRTPLAIISCFLFACQAKPPAPPNEQHVPTPTQEPQLSSQKLPTTSMPAEASGIALGPGGPAIVLDNSRGVFQGDPPRGISLTPHDDGYEGLTFDTRGQRFYAVVEAIKTKDGPRAQVDTYDTQWRLLESHPVDLKLPSRNKGIEGIAHAWVEDKLHLFLLCEAPSCDPDTDDGRGRIHVVEMQNGRWTPSDRIKLPKSLAFRDYSGLDIVSNQIAVTSQETRALWLGNLTRQPRQDGTQDWSVEGEGTVLAFEELCNLEGVALQGDTVHLVTDQRKSSQSEGCATLDQSLHTLTLPAP